MNLKERFTRIGLPVVAVLTSIGVGFAGVTSAQTSTTNSTTSTTAALTRQMGERGMRGERPAVLGKVTAISGTTITVQDQKPGESTTTEYTVDASSAKVLKGSQGAAPAESSVSAIAVGDMIAVRGAVNGSSVSATEIMDGVIPHGGRGMGRGTKGTVLSVSGTTITLTGSDGQTYTVDASAAQIGKVTAISIGDVKVGDTLNVMGEVSGTTVTAKHIMDGVPLQQN